jgi:hypothetical protein
MNFSNRINGDTGHMNKYLKPTLAFITVFAVAFTSGYLFQELTSGAESESRPGIERTEQWRGDRSEHGERDRQRMADRIAEYLELSDGQRAVFFERMGEYRSEIQEAVSRKREEEHATMIDMYKEMREEMAGILDEEQLERMDRRFHPDNIREMRERRGREYHQRRN